MSKILYVEDELTPTDILRLFDNGKYLSPEEIELLESRGIKRRESIKELLKKIHL